MKIQDRMDSLILLFAAQSNGPSFVGTMLFISIMPGNKWAVFETIHIRKCAIFFSAMILHAVDKLFFVMKFGDRLVLIKLPCVLFYWMHYSVVYEQVNGTHIMIVFVQGYLGFSCII